MFPSNESGWYPKVLTCSATTNAGIKEIWELIKEYEESMKEKGYFIANRQQQNLQWMYDLITYNIHNKFYNKPEVKKNLVTIEEQVETEKLPAIMAAKKLLDLFFKHT
jgi:LAO/AO transport system kinase